VDELVDLVLAFIEDELVNGNAERSVIRKDQRRLGTKRQSDGFTRRV
jgi:hypothetical protein